MEASAGAKEADEEGIVKPRTTRRLLPHVVLVCLILTAIIVALVVQHVRYVKEHAPYINDIF